MRDDSADALIALLTARAARAQASIDLHSAEPGAEAPVENAALDLAGALVRAEAHLLLRRGQLARRNGDVPSTQA